MLINFGAGWDAGWDVAWRRFVTVMIGITAAFVWNFVPRPVTARSLIRRKLASGITSDIGSIFNEVSNFARSESHPKAHESKILDMVINANRRLVTTAIRLQYVKFEPPIQGPWPFESYRKLMILQQELCDLMSAFVLNLGSMDPRWISPMLRRTGWYDRALMSDCLAIIYMTGNAIRTGYALPQLLPSPLIDRFFEKMNAVQQTSKEFGQLPDVTDHKIIRDYGYSQFAVGCTISFSIVSRLDALMTTVKNLVGEKFQSLGWPDLEKIHVHDT